MCLSFAQVCRGKRDGPGVQNEQLFWGNSNLVSFIKYQSSMACEVRCDVRHTVSIGGRSRRRQRRSTGRDSRRDENQLKSGVAQFREAAAIYAAFGVVLYHSAVRRMPSRKLTSGT